MTMDIITDLIIYFSFVLYEIYAKAALLFAVAFPKLTKLIIDSIVYKVYGITIDGPHPTDLKVLKPEKFYPRLASYLGYGLASGYVNEEWTVEDLKQATVKAMKSNQIGHISLMHPLRHIMANLNLQSREKAWENNSLYNLGNDLYEAMLDKNMQFSCGYWINAKNLDEAQLAKMDMIARKLHLKPGMRVLDLGCGFGTMGCYLAKNFGVSVVGCTLSMELLKYGKKICEGLPVELRLCDYRDMNEKFDRVISVEMLEHVGPKNYATFMAVVHRCLSDDGIALVECLGNNENGFPNFDVWWHKYFCPNIQIPTSMQIANAAGKHWVIEDWHNFGFDFVKTVDAWKQNFEKAWPNFQPKFGDRFYRLYNFFFCVSHGMFATRNVQVWHIVFRKRGTDGCYVSVR